MDYHVTTVKEKKKANYSRSGSKRKWMFITIVIEKAYDKNILSGNYLPYVFTVQVRTEWGHLWLGPGIYIYYLCDQVPRKHSSTAQV